MEEHQQGTKSSLGIQEGGDQWSSFIQESCRDTSRKGGLMVLLSGALVTPSPAAQ